MVTTMPDPIICIHIGMTTWQGPQSEVPAHLVHKLPPTPARRQIEMFSRRATEFYRMIGAIGQEDE